jgi:hypothetical protein
MTAIIDVIAGRILKSCLPRPLVREQDGMVRCDVVWELPPTAAVGSNTPSACDQRGFLASVDRGRNPLNERGGQNCKVLQLPITDLPAGAAPAGEGWYYDDSSEELSRLCPPSEPQRVAFTQAARPPNGVRVKLECLNETQHVDEGRTDTAPYLEVPTIGTGCGGEIGSEQASMDAACLVPLSNGSVDASMFCHPELNVCMRACTTARDCPAAWACDDRPSVLAATAGKAYCVNPVCGAGED